RRHGQRAGRRDCGPGHELRVALGAAQRWPVRVNYRMGFLRSSGPVQGRDVVRTQRVRTGGARERPPRQDLEGSSFQCPSETTSTVPSVTLKAVSSSIAYAGPGIWAAQLSASAIELPGMPSGARCGQIEKSTRPNVLSSPVGGLHWTKSSPILGVITMLPALNPTQTVSLNDGSMSATPDSRIQWH